MQSVNNHNSPPNQIAKSFPTRSTHALPDIRYDPVLDYGSVLIPGAAVSLLAAFLIVDATCNQEDS